MSKAKEQSTEIAQFNASKVLNRITWLADQGCKFNFDVDLEVKRLQKLSPSWKPEYAKKAADPPMRGGTVRTDSECSTLLEVPLNEVLAEANRINADNDDFLVEKDPFHGLSLYKPVRAFSALINAAKANNYPEAAWGTFLLSNGRQHDKAKFSALIAERLLTFTDDVLSSLVYSISNWLLNTSPTLAKSYSNTFYTLILKLINVLKQIPDSGKSNIVRGNRAPNWSSEAINSPTGKITEALFTDPKLSDLKEGGGLPVDWVQLIMNLLSLENDLRRHVLAILAYKFCWLYKIDPSWTDRNLIYVLNGNNLEDKNSIWSGFFSSAAIPQPELYERIKSNLLELAIGNDIARRSRSKVIAAILLDAWGNTKENDNLSYLTDNEFGDTLLNANDSFRCDVLWYVQQWSQSKMKSDIDWYALLPKFLIETWPRQISVKTSAVSSQLIDLAFSQTDRFPEIVEAIKPLLTYIDQGNLFIPETELFDKYPNQILDLFTAVLPNDLNVWPYNMDEILQKIANSDEHISMNEKYLDLVQKFHTR